LEDARLLVLPDAADSNLSNRATALGRIKAISGGDRVSINPKNLKVFECVIPARIVIVANRHPKFLDESGAMAMRELPIMFNRSFVNDARKDPQLGAKLKAELPGIANWALAGLRRLRKARRFTESAALQAARANIEGQQSHMATFARELLIFEDGESVSKSEMFGAYETWANWQRLSARERRDREGFKGDLLASASQHGVRLAQGWKAGKNEGERWRNVGINKRRLGQLISEDMRFPDSEGDLTT
jgi:phage/plasmid-associated DNA primase